MSDKNTKNVQTEADEALTLASDGRTISDFPNLEDLRNSYAATYGKRAFSRAVVGAEMGVPGPTIQRIERVTPKTTAVELEELENVLNRMAEDALRLADADAEDDEDEADEDE